MTDSTPTENAIVATASHRAPDLDASARADGRTSGSTTVTNRSATAAGWLVRTIQPDTAAALLRVWLGAMGMVHGYGKVFGGMDGFTTGVAKMGFPVPEMFAWSAGLTEFIGGALLVLGLGTRPVALLMAVTMAVAGLIRHADDPFKSKELALTYLVLSIVVVLIGPGRYALDAIFTRSGNRRSA